MPVLIQFEPFSSRFDPTFWNELANMKINNSKLSDSPLPIHAHYESHLAMPAYLSFTGDSFRVSLSDSSTTATSGTVKRMHAQLNGTLYNTNTIEDYGSKLNKKQIFSEMVISLWKDIQSGNALANPNLLCRFALFTFADLKKYKFTYWLCVPALVMDKNPTTVTSCLPISQAFPSIHTQIINTINKSNISSPYCTIRITGDIVNILELKYWKEGDVVAYYDPSSELENVAGWPLRNLTALFSAHLSCQKLRVLSFRDSNKNEGPFSSLVFELELGSFASAPPKAVGFERNTQGKLGPDHVDLSETMDPLRMAETTANLNLKLMRWRLVPDLDLEIISQQKCLLLGSGTLGCNVARCLMGWGVKSITLIDNGTVSYSNLTRQPLYEFNDYGKPKALVAADNLIRIFPSLDVRGLDITIPMPGHTARGRDTIMEDFIQLENEIRNHDVIFLLTDSRESRWLPTVMGNVYEKHVINIALGFDSYLVMRHGLRGCSDESTRLGCYFCNDVIAPTDQCTVTRPGLAGIASNIGVELLISILQHPLKGNAAADINDNFGDSSTCLGIVPHQIRGFISHFKTMLIEGSCYNQCTACSETISKAYEKDGFNFVYKVIHEPNMLEKLTGLDKLHEEGENLDLDWNSDESDIDKM